jgi:2-hydroxychromene-2-carboxylate isomerase
MTSRHLVIYGDFDCPWSYLASRRAAMLSAKGARVDWRAVEHAPAQDGTDDMSHRFEELRTEIGQVEASLLTGEQFPFALAGFLPHTRAAVAAYAEAYATGASAVVRALLFDALWLHSLDLADRSVVHTLVVDAVRTQPPYGQALARWEYEGGAADAIHETAAELAATWDQEWRALSHGVVPLILIEGVKPLCGVQAVAWLGQQLLDGEPRSEEPCRKGP